MRHIIYSALLFSLFLMAGCAGFNRYPTGGSLVLENLAATVKVIRDEKGMAYIYADSLDDAMHALGYVAAQDRLFQMTLTRLFAQGRISELAGDIARGLDIRHRTLGFHRQAAVLAENLAPEDQRLLENYIAGINAYIQTGADSYPIEFKLAGIAPEPWTVADSLSILYYMSWDSSANLKSEIIAQMLIERLGEARAGEIFPLNINPDDQEHPAEADLPASAAAVRISADAMLMGFLHNGAKEIGSNNWVTGPAQSDGGKPIVSNDPHLETGILPGIWYPAGIITPDLRIVGVHITGLPVMPIFRNEHVAVGITNAYGDVQDLYIETLDPANPDQYLEGKNSIAFTIIGETLKIRDKNKKSGFREETVEIRYTRRGPVVSDVLKGLDTDKVMSLRWAPYEPMKSRLGVAAFMRAKSVDEIRRCLTGFDVIMLNFVFGDTAGNIGWHVSGRLPVRSGGDGSIPTAVTDGADNWVGFVAFDEMPQAYNPDKGWLGTCNHNTVNRDFPYYYSTFLSPSYRYRRLKQLMEEPGVKTAKDHWNFQRDTVNLMAERMVPFMVDTLADTDETKDLAEILRQWDRRDNIDSAGATIFHAIYERFAWHSFVDELGEDLAKTMLGTWYFWQERFEQMVATDRLDHWFDDITTTDKRETKQDILIRAAMEARADLADALGNNPAKWLWGKVHRHTFVSPIRREGFGKGLLGGGDWPAPGSVEVLYRGIYDYNAPYDVKISASLRMTADLADADKVLAVLPGGIAGRLFHPHAKDQIPAFMEGEEVYWWFSDREIQNNTQSLLMLTPSKK
jgi:penicillin G amidase